MAKKGKAEGVTLSRKLAAAVQAVKRPFAQYVAAFGALSESRAELAPKFMKAANLWAAENGGQFVDFVRYLDPSVPIESRGPQGYRAHRTYAAADYLRRLRNRRDTGDNRARPVRSNVAGLARMIATIVPMMADVEAFWKGVATELDLKTRQMTRLRAVVATSQPIVRIQGVRPVPVRIVHVDPATQEATPAAAPVAAPAGRRAA